METIKKLLKFSRLKPSLSSQLLIAFGLSLTTVGFTTLFVNYLLIQENLKAAIKKEAQVLTQTLVFSTESALDVGYQSILRRVVQNYGIFFEVEEIAIIDPQGKILASSNQKYLHKFYQSEYPEFVLSMEQAAKTGIEQNFQMIRGGQPVLVEILPFSSTLFHAPGLRGLVIVILDLKQMQKQAWQTFSHSTTTLFSGGLIIMGVMGFLIEKMVLKPLRELNQAVISSKEKGVLEFSVASLPNNEIRSVAKTFEITFKELKAYEKSLQNFNEQLELEVEFRTQEFKEANDQLELEIIERAKIEKELRNFTEKLKVSNRELEDFAYVASHDLQEPLRKIQTFGDRLISKYGDSLGERGQDYLARMQNAAGRAQTLIIDLLSFSRVTTKAKPFVKVDLEDIIQGVLSDLEIKIEQVEGKIEIEPLPKIEADSLQMRQLFQNLIGNALKFHREYIPPQIKIYANLVDRTNSKDVSHHQWLQIFVEDNGIGFEEKYTDRIFNVFQRLHGRGTYEGTGVGLAICRKIVERHGGTITAQSELDYGAIFCVTLPIQQSTNSNQTNNLSIDDQQT